MVKFSRKFAAVLAVAFLMLGAGSLDAQAQTSWKGHTPDEVMTQGDPKNFNDYSKDDSKVVYLYNVDKKQFLCVGGVNNTEAVLGDFSADAVKFLLIKPSSNLYQLKSQYGNNDPTFVNTLGVKVGPNSTQYTEADNNKVFVNLSTASNGYQGICNIDLQKQSENSYVLIFDDNGYKRYLRGVNANAEVSTDINPGLSGEEWQFVTLADIKADAESKFASESNPVDMTYLIKDANFNRFNTEYTAWKASGYPIEGNRSLNEDSLASLVNGYTWFTKYAYFYKGNGFGDIGTPMAIFDISKQRDYAKYFAGVLQYFDKGKTGSAHQTITLPKAGTYRIKVRGLKIDGSYGAGRSYAYVDYNGKRDSSYAFINTSDYNSFVDQSVGDKLAEKLCGADEKIKSNDIYLREVTFDVNESNETIDLGVELSGTSHSGMGWGEYDWTLFDDFTLEYLGEKAVLDENQNDVQYINDQQKNDEAKTVYLKRSLKVGQWNTICLPVNLTKEQIEKTFGEGTVVSQLSDYDKKGKVINFKTTDQMIMYIPYLIKPTSKGIAEGKSVTAGNVTIEAPYYVIENVVLNPVNKLHDQYQATTDGVQFFSVFANTTDKPVHVGDYGIGENGSWYHLTSEHNIKGFRAWMRLNAGGTSDKIQLSVDGQNQGSMTAINGIADDEQAPANIYNVNGQLVRSNATNANGLPKGLYIKGGKKFVVK